MIEPRIARLDPHEGTRYPAPVRIALAQIDTKVGAFAENAAAVVARAQQAADAGAALVVFPELTLCGYPPKDLLELREFVSRQQAALLELARDPVFDRLAALVGFAESHAGAGAGLYNSAALIERGKVAQVARKSLLPTYDVFDEGRYFDPAPEVALLSIGGALVGVTICEDLWNDKQFWRQQRYARDPVEELVARGAQAIVNLSASPYAMGKPQRRRAMVQAAARRHGVPIALCNLVGGNDSIVFDGRSLLIDASGAIQREAGAFVEELIVGEFAVAPGARAQTASGDGAGAPTVAAAYETDLGDVSCGDLVAGLTLGIRDYARKTGFKSAVLGLSGGVDSALTAVLAARALGPEQVTCLAMPSRYTAAMSNDDAAVLARRLGLRFETIPIEPMFEAYLAALGPIFAGRKPDVTEENLQARIRGTLLMAFSNKTGALLLSTGNKSELATGFCTLYGDMAGGLAAIGDLSKTAVYAVCRWLNRQQAGERETELIPERILTRPPTAELRENQTDQDTLPPYDELDQVLSGHVEEHLGADELVQRGLRPEVVGRVLKLVAKSEYKRRQAAPVLRVTARAFGEGWRFPIAQGYRY